MKAYSDINNQIFPHIAMVSAKYGLAGGGLLARPSLLSII
jgi:hypothetical protein